MGLFGSILHKLGFGEDEKKNAKPIEVASVTEEEVVEEVAPVAQVAQESVEVVKAKEAPVVDVMKQLEELSSKNPGFNWKTSIVDLLKLLGLESSYSFRKKLAKELECPADLMADSAKMNIWLHKTVLKKISENGGNIPEDLLN